jgi:hypothetical protein
MRLRWFISSAAAVVGAATTAHALTSDEIRAKLEAAGYTQIREIQAGKIKTFKAVKDGQERSVIVDTSGHIKELQ